ncbi:HAD family hydrolase [Pedobacter gandavensis]|uniref:HAD-IA family hydrolase n=1 Tax=Pedobacter gandavensis TaxID=2679963 RepID=A0ABR6F2X2_9SPHI|nr:HAD family phosphatase [Pedobacter gandavensis]MBB2151561.1 HAD-IA family hydrolase [Pedobacter gandavensis]
MKNLKAILFDLDGTLIDSEYFHYECWNEVLGEYGIQLDYTDWLKNYAGIPLPVNAKNLLSKYAISADLADVVKRREALTLERLKTKDVELMPYALDMIEFLYERKLLLAIVTSSPREDVAAIFNRNGLKKYFTLIITRTDVIQNKPAPEGYQKCCAMLGVVREECIVYEDTLNGIKAAKAAGIRCIAIQSNTDVHPSLAIADELFLDFKAAKTALIAVGV